MSDEQDKPTLTRKPLGLKRTVEAGQVQQQFSHGRRNTVVVEVKRRRVLGRPGDAAPVEVEEVEAAPAPAPTPAPAPAPAPKPAAPRVSENDSLMSRQERQAQLLREAEESRMNALEDNRRRDEAARVRAVEEEKARAEAKVEQATAKAADPAPAAPAAEAPAAAPAAEAPAAAAAPQSEAAPTPAPRATTSAAPAPRRFTPVAAPQRPEPKRPEPKATRGGDSRRQSGKLTVTRALNEDEGARARSLAALKRAREKEKRSHTASSGPREKQIREVVVPESITVQDLANRMAEKTSDLVKALFKMGVPSASTDTIDQDTAELLVAEFGHEIIRVSEGDIDIRHDEDVDDAEHL